MGKTAYNNALAKLNSKIFRCEAIPRLRSGSITWNSLFWCPGILGRLVIQIIQHSEPNHSVV